MTLTELKRIIEALILCHDAPMSLAHIKQSLNSDLSNEQLRALLDEIAVDWQARAINLVQVSTGWRFQSAPDLVPFLERMRSEKPASYSRAVLETLAIVAYRQPVTRGDIEDIRGVAVSSEIIKKLEERGWIDVVGHREVPGRPALFATTKQFLDDLGFQNLRDLPPLDAQEDVDDEPQLSLDGINQLTHVIKNHVSEESEKNKMSELVKLTSSMEHSVESFQDIAQAETHADIQTNEVFETESANLTGSLEQKVIEQTELEVNETRSKLSESTQSVHISSPKSPPSTPSDSLVQEPSDDSISHFKV